MSKRNLYVVIAVAVCVVAAAGGLLASNMGFKLNYPLNGPGGANGQGKTTLSLPFFRQTNVDDAFQLINDIGIANVANVQNFNEATNLFEAYTGRSMSPKPNFPLTATVGVLVQASALVNYIVVGSHDPTAAAALEAPGAGHTQGKSFLAPPYNITSADAFAAMNDVGFASTANIQRFNRTTSLFEAYTGRSMSPKPNFPIVPGEAYIIQMSSPVSYIASHY